MARYCDVCGKVAQVGNSVSHSNVKTKRVWSPNVQTVRAIVNGTVRRLKVCTRCLRSGRIKRGVAGA